MKQKQGNIALAASIMVSAIIVSVAWVYSVGLEAESARQQYAPPGESAQTPAPQTHAPQTGGCGV